MADEGGKPKKPPKPYLEASRAGAAACQAAQGCGLPQAKLWEKGAAFMAFLNASRQKQEDDKVNLVEKAAEVYPACLEMWFATHAAESPPSLEVWSAHPDNKAQGEGEGGGAATVWRRGQQEVPRLGCLGPGQGGGERPEGLL